MVVAVFMPITRPMARGFRSPRLMILQALSQGIEGYNAGSGNLYINAGGITTGNGVNDYGISASNSPNGVDLVIVADTVIGGYQGIRAGNGGKGQLSITTTGTISGRYDTGIHATNNATGTDFTIVSAITTGAFYGIYARAKGYW